MDRDAFSNLCSLISAAVGHDTFRPENSLVLNRNSASLFRRGGHVPGEIKVAISIRILAGGSYLDLVPLFDVCVSRIYVIFDKVLDSWVLKTFQFPLVQYLQEENWTALAAAIAKPFRTVLMGFLMVSLVLLMD